MADFPDDLRTLVGVWDSGRDRVLLPTAIGYGVGDRQQVELPNPRPVTVGQGAVEEYLASKGLGVEDFARFVDGGDR